LEEADRTSKAGIYTGNRLKIFVKRDGIWHSIKDKGIDLLPDTGFEERGNIGGEELEGDKVDIDNDIVSRY
jgi:hypothetical protein